MKKLMILFKGEMIKLIKYKVLLVSILVSFIWAVILFFSSGQEVASLMPLLLMVDASMMTIIYLCASLYLEKQEGSIKSLLVSPVSLKSVIIAKVLSSISMSIISGLFLGLISYFYHGVSVNFFLMLIYLAVIVFSHTAIGFVLFLNARDFSQMLGFYIFYALLAFIPTILSFAGVIPQNLDFIFIISPSYASQILIGNVLLVQDLLLTILAVVYLLILGGVLYGLYIYKNLKKNLVKG